MRFPHSGAEFQDDDGFCGRGQGKRLVFQGCAGERFGTHGVGLVKGIVRGDAVGGEDVAGDA